MCCPQTHSVGSSARLVTDSVTFNAAEPWSIVSVFSIQYGVRYDCTQNRALTCSGVSVTIWQSQGISADSLCWPISAPMYSPGKPPVGAMVCHPPSYMSCHTPSPHPDDGMNNEGSRTPHGVRHMKSVSLGL